MTREKPITIKHKDGDDVAEVMPSAFERVWSKRGWTRVDDKNSETPRPAPQSKKEQS